MYNVLYKNKFYIIDHLEYNYSQEDTDQIKIYNNNIFNMELYYFLIDGFFDELISKNKILKELYITKSEDIIFFISLFKNYLSELLECEIHKLSEAKIFQNKKTVKKHYIRQILL